MRTTADISTWHLTSLITSEQSLMISLNHTLWPASLHSILFILTRSVSARFTERERQPRPSVLFIQYNFLFFSYTSPLGVLQSLAFLQDLPLIFDQFQLLLRLWTHTHNRLVLSPAVTTSQQSKVLTKSGKQNQPSFPDFPDPVNSFFQTTMKCKCNLTNHLISQFDSFLAQLQNTLFEEHGDWLHPCQSLCHPTITLSTRCPSHAYPTVPSHNRASSIAR